MIIAYLTILSPAFLFYSQFCLHLQLAQRFHLVDSIRATCYCHHQAQMIDST